MHTLPVQTRHKRTITGERLRLQREAWQLTQTQLGDYLDVSVATVCRWEGRRKLTAHAALPSWVAYAVMGLASDLEATGDLATDFDALNLPTGG